MSSNSDIFLPGCRLTLEHSLPSDNRPVLVVGPDVYKPSDIYPHPPGRWQPAWFYVERTARVRFGDDKAQWPTLVQNFIALGRKTTWKENYE